MQARQLIVDLETTGLKAQEGHRIVEFAALEMINRKLTGNYLQIYINPERRIDATASQIHGITDAMVSDKPTFKQVVQQIAAYLQDSELIIHNAKFDMGFLEYQFNLVKQELSVIKSVHDYITGVIDTLMIARQKFPGGKNSLDALCDRFKVNRDERTYHGALIDCQLLAQVYLALTKEQINLLENDTAAKKSSVELPEFKRLDTQGLNLAIITPSDEEYQLHTEYLKTLDKLSHGQSAWYNKTHAKE